MNWERTVQRVGDLFSDLSCSAMVKREEGLNKECVERDKGRDKASVRQLTC